MSDKDNQHQQDNQHHKDTFEVMEVAGDSNTIPTMDTTVQKPEEKD